MDRLEPAAALREPRATRSTCASSSATAAIWRGRSSTSCCATGRGSSAARGSSSAEHRAELFAIAAAVTRADMLRRRRGDQARDEAREAMTRSRPAHAAAWANSSATSARTTTRPTTALPRGRRLHLDRDIVGLQKARSLEGPGAGAVVRRVRRERPCPPDPTSRGGPDPSRLAGQPAGPGTASTSISASWPHSAPERTPATDGSVLERSGSPLRTRSMSQDPDRSSCQSSRRHRALDAEMLEEADEDEGAPFADLRRAVYGELQSPARELASGGCR